MDFSTAEYETLDQVREMLEKQADGVATLKMWQLRDAFGARKLGSNIVEEISGDLDRLGIGHIPLEMVPDQWADTRLYLRSSSCGRYLDAAIKPGAITDETIRRYASNDDSDTLEKIRRLIK